jgi:hypothetical protein
MYLMDPVARKRLRDVMNHMYFAPEIRPQVASPGLVNLAVFAYRKGKNTKYTMTQKTYKHKN